MREQQSVSTILIKRQERKAPPAMPSGEIHLESPPEIPAAKPAGLMQTLMWLPMVAGGGAMALMFVGGGGNAIQSLASGLFGLSMVGMMFGQIGNGAGERKFKLDGARRDYLRYLAQTRKRVRKAAAEQREALEWNSPDPESLWSLVMSARLWERRPADTDFGQLRIGKGPQKLAIELVAPETKPIEDLEPMCAGALRRFMRAHAIVPDLPVAVSVASFARIILTGESERARGMVRAVIAQMAAFHSPDDVRIGICASEARMAEWEWAKWLPHCMHPTETDAAGPVRLLAKSLIELEGLFGSELTNRPRFSPGLSQEDLPYHLVVVDGGTVTPDSQLAADGIEGVCVIDLSPAGGVQPTPDAVTLRLHVTSEQMLLLQRDRTGKDIPTELGRADSFGSVRAEAVARQLAPLRTSATTGPELDALSADLTLTSLLGLADPYTLDTSTTWLPRAQRNRLRVPIGVDRDGRPVELDIKESAQGGMGPHGLCIGATGSGKSELLRTLVLSLAATHSSETLNFVLVDFKGGATFLGMDGLQHVSAIITNLEDELPLVDRMYDALQGEMVRRQEWLRAAGGYASQRDYERAREQGADLQPMPTLFIVLDEFSELLSAKPEFAELFVTIGRLGRSLGVHLLLASQRLEEGKLRGLDTHLSYRVGLRTFSAMESRVVLGVPDAYELPSAPGNGYLKLGTESMTRFKAAYVSGPVSDERSPAKQGSGPQHQRQIVWYGPDYVAPRLVSSPDAASSPSFDSSFDVEAEETLFDVIVKQLKGQGPPAHQIWLPPLDKSPTIGDLPTPPSTEGGQLTVPVGVVDRPFDQRRDPLWLDLSGAAGHVAVAGGPQTGTSTTLRTLICSLALLHSPQEVQFYCLDFGGGTLSSLAGLPHVGGVATRLDSDRVRRTVAEVTGLLAQREREFTERGIDSIATYRRLRAASKIPGDGYGDVFLVVDNWLTVRQEYELLEPVITDLAARGLGFGIHVVASVNKWSEFRMSIRDLFGTRLELRLGDPYESEVNRKLAENVPEGRPGRGLTREGLHFLTALPRIDGSNSVEDLSDGVAHLVRSVADSWQGPAAPAVRLLPSLLPVSALPNPADTGRRVPIGIDEDTLSPVLLDFEADPHFLVFGDNECGKSNLLRIITEGIVARNTQREACLIFFDYRRSLLDTADTEHRIGYAASSNAATDLISDVVGALHERLPPADLTPDQLRNRSWWKGADLYLVADDYDLIATSSNPLLPIAELLPQARDIGLHLILTRAMGGAGRALFDPIIQRLKDMATPGLIMSGSRDEGVLLSNIRPRPLPKGRGTLVTRRTGTHLIQTAHHPPRQETP